MVIVQVEFPVPILIPVVRSVALKKSETLFALRVFPLLSIAALVPIERTPLTGRFAPAPVMVQLLILLPSLPVVVPVLKNTTPLKAVEAEPCRLQF